MHRTSALLLALGLCAVVHAATPAPADPQAAPAPQQVFASEVLGALARRDELALEELVAQQPFRAVPLVHDLLQEAACAPAGDERSLRAARDIAAAHARLTEREQLAQVVRTFEAQRTVLAPRARAFREALARSIAALESGDLELLDERLEEALQAAGQEAYLEWRARRVAVAAYRSQGRSAACRTELERLLEIEGELQLSEAEIEDLRTLGELELDAGRWAAAIDRYQQALVLSIALLETRQRGALYLGLAAAQARSGRDAQARDALDRAIAVERAAGRPREEAWAHLQASFLGASTGHYARALSEGQAALQLYGAGEDRSGVQRARMHLAAVRSELGLIVDAESEVALALEALDDRDPPHDRAWARRIQGLARLDAGQAQLALESLDRARALFIECAGARCSATGCASGEGRAAAEVLRGRALLELGRPGQARSSFRATLEHASSDSLQRSLAWTGLGDALAAEGENGVAETAYGRAIEEGSASPGLEGSWRASLGLGRLAQAEGRPREALEHYLTAIDAVEEIRRVLAAPSLRLRYLGDKLELYRRATHLMADAGDLEQAFQMSERLRARTLLEFAALRPAADPATDSPARTRVRAAESRLMLLESEPGQDDSPGTHAGTHAGAAQRAERIEHARLEHAAARRGLELADTRAALLGGLHEPRPAGEIQAELAPTEALLAYVTARERTSVFVLRADRTSHVTLPLQGSALVDAVDAFLQPTRLLRAGHTDVANLGFDARASHELYGALVAPILSELAGCELLWIVADGALRELPFAALVEQVEPTSIDSRLLYAHHRAARYLIETFALAYLPSAGLLDRARSREPASGAALALIAPQPLPGGALALAPIEGAAQTATHPERRTLVGSDASEALFKQLAPDASQLHIATHGYLDDRRPAYSRVALAPGAGEDGWLHAYEVEALSLRATRVVLAACETLGSRASTGRGEGLLGLARAFLAAGAHSVIATAWRVDDRATDWLVQRYHEALGRGEPSSSALRQAQIATLRQGGREQLCYANPFFWAGFSQIGQD